MKGNTRKRFALGGTKAAVWGLSVLTLVFGMSLALAGCGGDDGGDDDKPPANTTPTGMQWTAVAADKNGDFSFSDTIRGVAYGGTGDTAKWVAIGTSKVATSADGTTWADANITNISLGNEYSISGVAYGDASAAAKWVAVGPSNSNRCGKIAISTDGSTWVDATNNFGNTVDKVQGIAYGGAVDAKKFVTVGVGGSIAYSTDGTSWTAVEKQNSPKNGGFGTNGFTQITGVAYGNRWVAVGRKTENNNDYTAHIAYSADGTDWTGIADDKTGGLTASSGTTFSVAYGNGKWVVVGTPSVLSGTSEIAISADGTDWTKVTTEAFDYKDYSGTTKTAKIKAVAYGKDKFMAVGEYGKIATSSDGGATWTAVDATAGGFTLGDSSNDAIYGVAYAAGKWVIVGAKGKIAYCAE